jgi:hypothetical protein
MSAGRRFTIGRLLTAQATDPAMALVIAPAAAPIAPAAALTGVAAHIGRAAAATVAERIRGKSAERPTSLIVAPSAPAR